MTSPNHSGLHFFAKNLTENRFRCSPKEYDDIQVMAEDVNFNKYVLLSQDIAISISPQDPPEERNWLMTICYAGEVIRSGLIQKCLPEDDVQLSAQESSILIIDTQ